MAGTKEEQIQAADRVCRKLNISLQELLNRLGKYNQRVYELNCETIEYTKKFIAPKGTMVNGQIEYDLNDDDRAILAGYKKHAIETLEKEFPELFDVMDDLKYFENNKINLDMYD